MLEKYRHKETWARRGEHFNIEICRWETMSEETLKKVNMGYPFSLGRFVWNIYIYLFPDHPLFDKANVDDYEGCPINSFHGGCTYSDWKYGENGSVTCKQYGCDYNHFMDDEFTNTENPEDATEVFRDAEEIFEELGGEENGR